MTWGETRIASPGFFLAPESRDATLFIILLGIGTFISAKMTK
jgi:hypothetical protein